MVSREDTLLTFTILVSFACSEEEESRIVDAVVFCFRASQTCVLFHPGQVSPRDTSSGRHFEIADLHFYQL